MRPKVLGDRTRGDWSVVSCKETVQRLFKGIKMRSSSPNVKEFEVYEVRSDEVNLMRAVVPNTSNQRVGLVGSPRDVDDRGVSMNQGVNNQVECDYNKVGILNQPLEVVFTPYLEMGGVLVVEGNGRMIIGNIPQLRVWFNQTLS